MKKIKNIIFICLGFICLVLGTIGLFLPIIPTVPFLLLTAFFFARGSKKFHNWFLNTKLYKNRLENFVTNKVMTLKSKIFICSFVSAFLIIAMIKVNNLFMTITLSFLIIIKILYFSFCIKTISNNEIKKLKESNKKEIQNA